MPQPLRDNAPHLIEDIGMPWAAMKGHRTAHGQR